MIRVVGLNVMGTDLGLRFSKSFTNVSHRASVVVSASKMATHIRGFMDGIFMLECVF